MLFRSSVYASSNYLSLASYQATSTISQADHSLWFTVEVIKILLLQVFSNADWAGCRDNHRSIGAFVYFLVTISFLGAAKSNRQLLGLVQR